MKQGKRVARITVAWSTKGADAINAAWKELQASKVGRRARINGTAEHVADPLPSMRRLLRQARLADASPELHSWACRGRPDRRARARSPNFS
jgi:hypothetical protein